MKIDIEKVQGMCRFCDNLSPHDRDYYDMTATWLCYENRDSCDCSLNYRNDCKHFVLSSVIEEVLNG